MGDRLTEFLRSRKEQAAKPEINWQARKDNWVRSVEGLYALVRKMLRKSIESKDVSVRTFDLEVTEDYIGTYTIPALELNVGAERVEFRPKGIMVLGAEGRVDIRGAGDTVTMIKRTENGDSVWTVVVQRVRHLEDSAA